MERNSLAENRVSLSIFNYHTWIEYEKLYLQLISRLYIFSCGTFICLKI